MISDAKDNCSVPMVVSSGYVEASDTTVVATVDKTERVIVTGERLVNIRLEVQEKLQHCAFRQTTIHYRNTDPIRREK